MAQVVPSFERAERTREMVGGALGLLGSFIAAMAFAFLMPRLAFYVTFLMPVLVGFLLSALGSIGPRRFGFGDARALVGMMVLASVVAWAGHHLFAYLRMVDFLAAQTNIGGVSPADPTAAALAWIEESTGASGYWGYLAFVSTGPAAAYSPIGLLGKSEIGATGTAIVAVVELLLMIGTASWSILFRTRSLRSNDEAKALGRVDREGLAQVMALVEAKRFEDAGAACARGAAEATHEIVLRDGEVTTEIMVFTLDADGRADERVAMKLVPREAGKAMRRAFAAARRAG